MAKVGRPKSENPRSERVFVRLTKQEYDQLHGYAKRHGISLTRTLVEGLEELIRKEQ